MRNGFDHKVGDGDTRLSVRRCSDDDGEEIVELTCETTKDGWFLSSVFLSPDQAIQVARDLLAEATAPLVWPKATMQEAVAGVKIKTKGAKVVK